MAGCGVVGLGAAWYGFLSKAPAFGRGFCFWMPAMPIHYPKPIFSPSHSTCCPRHPRHPPRQRLCPENLAEMRKQNFSVDPSTPGARPMIAPTSREGTKFFAAPQEVDELVKAGNRALPTDAEAKILADDAQKGQAQQGWLSKTLAMRPDAQSPEAQAIRDKIQNWQTMNLANSPMFREQIKDKAIGGAVVASAPVAAATAGAFVPTAVAVPGGVGFGGAAASETLGPSLATQGIKWLVAHPKTAWSLLGTAGATIGGGGNPAEGVKTAIKWALK
jgi:hypothetical protein